MIGAEWIVGVVGVLQFEVMADRIRTEFGIPVAFEPTQYFTARWLEADDKDELKKFADANRASMATDHDGAEVFLARNAWHLNKAQEDFPKVHLKDPRTDFLILKWFIQNGGNSAVFRYVSETADSPVPRAAADISAHGFHPQVTVTFIKAGAQSFVSVKKAAVDQHAPARHRFNPSRIQRIVNIPPVLFLFRRIFAQPVLLVPAGSAGQEKVFAVAAVQNRHGFCPAGQQ